MGLQIPISLSLSLSIFFSSLSILTFLSDYASHLLRQSDWPGQELLFRISKKAETVTIIGVKDLHVDDISDSHPNMYTLIQFDVFLLRSSG